MKFTEALAIAVALALVVASLALGIDGTPNANEVITVDRAIGITANLCRVGQVSTGPDGAALVQVQSNGIYYRLDANSGWPLATTGALTGSVGDIIELAFPSRFRAAPQSGSNGRLSVTCFQR